MVKKETQLGLNGKKAKPKEITIKLNLKYLKTIGYILLVMLLVGIIFAQQIGWIPTKDFIGSATSYLNNTKNKVENAKNTPGVTIIKPNGSETFASDDNDNNSQQNESETNTQEDDKEEDELLPITGEIIFTIDDINIDPKENIEDYARITSVTFTIKNQDKELEDPEILGYLGMYGNEDDKTIELSDLEAGHQITETETELTFGYNDVEEEHTLNLELYDEDGLVKKVSKKFN